MAFDKDKVVEDEIIERMMRDDPTFMYKIQLIKDEILYNYGEYADSIGEFNSDLDLEGGTTIPNTLKGGFDGMIDTMGLKFDTIIDAFNDIGAMASLNDTENTSEGIFASDDVNVIISDISNEAIDKLTDTLELDPDSDEKTIDKKLKDKSLLKKVFAGIVGTAAAIGIWSKYGDDIKGALKSGWEEHGGAITKSVKGAFKIVGQDISTGMDLLGNQWDKHGEAIKDNLHDGLEATGKVIDKVLEETGEAIVHSITGLNKDEREEAAVEKGRDHMVSVLATELEGTKDVDKAEVARLLKEYNIQAKGGGQKSFIKTLNKMGLDLTDAEDLRTVDAYLASRLSGRTGDHGPKTAITPQEIVRELMKDPQFRNNTFQSMWGLKEDAYATYFEDLNEKWIEDNKQAVEILEVGDINNRTAEENNKLFKKSIEVAEDNDKRQEVRTQETNSLLQDIADKPVASSGGAEVSLDFGEIRESTLDASFNWRSKYHNSRRI